ncbi:MAG: T9SS type A sorting domain-containing protein, partial [Ignavibacteria bacterium]
DLDGIYIYDRNEIITNISIFSHYNIPSGWKLFQNYPNPFNPSTTIKFSLNGTVYVTLKIYNFLGQEITQLLSQEMNAGTFAIDWDASKYASGVYFYYLQAGSFSETKKLILLK